MTVKHHASDPDEVIAAYDLDPAAHDALKCVATMERLTRRIRFALKGEDGHERGVVDAERLIVIACRLVRDEVKKRWSLNGAEAVRIKCDQIDPDAPRCAQKQEAPQPTDPFSNW